MSTEGNQAAALPKAGLGARPLGVVGIVIVTAYTIVASVLLIYSIVVFWPTPAPAEGSTATTSSAAFLVWTLSIPDETRLFLVVVLAGALGSLVHSLRSLYWYVGNREMVLSWIVMYILLPFVGATLSLVFYFVIRGGFFSPSV